MTKDGKEQKEIKQNERKAETALWGLECFSIFYIFILLIKKDNTSIKSKFKKYLSN